MKRRDFMKTSLLTAGAAALGAASGQAAEGAAGATREIYELRLYHLRRGPMQRRFDDFFRDLALPAFNRAGVGPVGVFNVMFGPDSPTTYLLLPHKTPESFFTMDERLLGESGEFKQSEFVNTPATDPGYIRAESSLMAAFSSIPKLEVPAATAERRPRIFELRTYESHSRQANKKKIEMFNIGEIVIFRRTGLTPVFFGETLIGAKQPNLTYMLAFENMAERDKNWAAFGADPEWRKLSATPGYTDPEIVTNISTVFLRPAPYSQI